MAETTNQKIVRLETQMQNVSSEVSEIKAGVASLIVKVDGLILAQTEITALKGKIEGLEVEINSLKGKTFRNGWVFPTLAAVAGSVLTFLIISYLQNAGK